MGLVKVGLAFLQPDMKDERNKPNGPSVSPSRGGKPIIPQDRSDWTNPA